MAIKELFQDSRPQVLFDPRASQRIDPRFKFTRNGTASYYDEGGVLRFAAANEPRFDHNPTTGESLGLLVEKAGTNSLLNSNQFAAGNWTITSGTIVADATPSPDGSVTADKLVTSNTTAQQRIVSAGLSAAAGTYAFSVYAKSAGFSFMRLETGTNTSIVNFDLSQGVLGTNSGSGIITSIGNGWYRCSMQIIASTTLSDIRIYIIGSAADIRLSTLAGNGNGGIFLWGAQLEAGTFPTSYIPTTGAAVTRPADLISIEGSSLPSTGSIYIDARALTSDVNDTLLSAANASNAKLTLAIRQPASLYNSKALVYEVGGAFKPTLPFPVPGNTRERNLITYGTNNFHYRGDSARLTPSSSASVPVVMTRFGIGHDVTDPTRGFNGYINSVYLWSGEITPTVAEALVRGDVDPKNADAGVFAPAAGSLAFVFNTQGISTDGNTVVQLPLRGSTNNVLVEWGDNTSSSLIGAAASVTVNHTYPSAGIYPVQVVAESDGTNSGLENLQFFNNSSNDLVRVLQWGGTTTWQPTTMFRAFRDCTRLDFENAARTNLPNTSAITNWQEAFYNGSSITGQFPAFDTSSATTFNETWLNCNQVTSYPQFNTANVTNFTRAWRDNTSLTSFPTINTSSGTTFGGTGIATGTWSNCNQMGSFPLLDFSSAITLAGAWANCSSLTSFPAINTASVTRFGEGNPTTGAWEGCSSLTSFPLINTSSASSLGRAWQGCSSLTSFPSINTSNCQNFFNTWNTCSSLTTFPALNFSSATGNLGGASSGDGTWRGLSLITSFPFIDTSGINGSIAGAWGGCSGLTSFPLLDFSSVIAFGATNQGAWFNCSSLTSFPTINTSSGTNFAKAWLSCSGLTSFPTLDTSNGTIFESSWNSCSGLTTFPLLDFSLATNIEGAWRNCTGLTSFPAIDTSSVVVAASISGSITGAWTGCSGLTSFPALNLSNCQVFGAVNGGAWTGCAGLTAFPSISFVAAITFHTCWLACSGMVDFPAGLFNGWTGTPANNCFVLTWSGCTSLSATSVENILNSINTSGRSAPASGKDITISYNAGSGTPSISTAVTALKSRGWTITLNGVAQ